MSSVEFRPKIAEKALTLGTSFIPENLIRKLHPIFSNYNKPTHPPNIGGKREHLSCFFARNVRRSNKGTQSASKGGFWRLFLNLYKICPKSYMFSDIIEF